MRGNTPGEREERLRSAWPFFYNPTLVCGLAFVNSVRPVTLAAGMLYVLVPIQLFVSATRLQQEARREALT